MRFKTEGTEEQTKYKTEGTDEQTKNGRTFCSSVSSVSKTFCSSVTFVFTLLASVLLCSCGDTQNEFSSLPCYLVIDNAAHQDATLASAMTPYAGVFTTITLANHGGARYFHFASNQDTSSETIFNGLDQRRTLRLGQNDGLIVGYGTQSDPLPFYDGAPSTPLFYAFDRECPNCYDDSRVPIRSYPIRVSANGMGTCANCQRTYNLNSGGNIASGDGGQKLTRYRAATTGAYGVLTVN